MLTQLFGQGVVPPGGAVTQFSVEQNEVAPV